MEETSHERKAYMAVEVEKEEQAMIPVDKTED